MSAIISECGQYRYRLERDVQMGGIIVALIGVNPSTADATTDDATIRKDIGFGLRNGWGRIIKGNAFAYRATDVRALGAAIDPVGPETDEHLRQIMADADLVVPCWGGRNKLPKRLRCRLLEVMRLIVQSDKPVLVFGLTGGADPLHPLVLPYSTELRPWWTIDNERASRSSAMGANGGGSND